MEDLPLAPERLRVLGEVADRVPAAPDHSSVRVGVDGSDGSGKSVFADDLAAMLRDRGRPVVRISLHRDELVAAWDLSVFLHAPFTVTAQRMALRDGTHPDPDHPDMHRYVQAQHIYCAACAPQERATVLVDNTDFRRPRILRS
jgi:hypothetical protein